MLQDDRAQAHFAHSHLHGAQWWHDRTAECEPDLHGVRQDDSLQGDRGMNNTTIEWTERKLGFLEGLIDADGSISLIKEKRPHFKAGCTYKPRMNIGNVCLELLERTRTIIGAGCINENKNHRLKPHYQRFYILDVSVNGIRRILPHLRFIVKERQRVLILEASDILKKRTGKGFGPRSDEDIARLEQIYCEIRERNGSVWNK